MSDATKTTQETDELHSSHKGKVVAKTDEDGKVVMPKKGSELVETQDNKAIEAAALSQTIDAFLLGTKTAEKLKPAQIQMCKQTALLFNLNPLKREIHFVPRAVKKKNPQTGYWDETGDYDVSIVIGYDVYIKRAEKIGLLNGWGVTFEKDGNDIKAILKINRKGWDQPFVHEVYLSEARQDRSPMWDKMPRFMLRKTVIGQGFRLCFPEDLGGLPYLPEEIGVGAIENGELHEELPATATKQLTPPAQKQPQPPLIPPANAADLVALLGLLKRKGKTQAPILATLRISSLKQLNIKQLANITAQLLELSDAPPSVEDLPVEESTAAIFGTHSTAPVVDGDQIADDVDAGLNAQLEQQGAM